MFALAGFEDAEAQAEAVFDVETRIAAHHWDRVRLRDLRAMYNPMPLADVVEVPWTATALEIERASRDSGRSRLVVVDDAGTPVGLVHVRDAVRATARGDLDLRAGDLVYDTVRLDEHENLLDAVSVMQEERSQLAFVTRAGRVVGITALEDLLERMLGEFDDETDPAVAPSR